MKIINDNLDENKIKDFVISIACYELGFKEYEDGFRNANYNEMKIIFTAIQNNNIVGTIMLDNNNFLKGLYVDKNYRRKGIAKMLLNKLIDYCKDNNILEIRLGTNINLKEAILFYEKNKFKRIENIYTNDKDDIYFYLNVNDYEEN